MRALTFFHFHVLFFTLIFSFAIGIRIPFKRTELAYPVAHAFARRKHDNHHNQHHDGGGDNPSTKNSKDASSSLKPSSSSPNPSPSLSKTSSGLPNPSSSSLSTKSDNVKTTANNGFGATIGGNLGNYYNNRYSANCTLNGKNVVLALDTGSADLVAIVPRGYLGEFNDTGMQIHSGFGDGSYGVNGTISYASLEFGNFKVQHQAFINVSNNTIGGITDIGMNGILGLSFGGVLDDTIRQIYGPNATAGQPFLTNLFSQNASLPAFFTIQLSRTADLESTEGGNLDIATYDPLHEEIQNAPKLYVYPPDNGAWTVMLDGLQLDGKDIPIQSFIQNTPPGKAVALLDTGTPGMWLSHDIFNKVYQAVPGSAFSNSTQTWFLPCNTTSILSVSLGGQNFSIHPLDLSSLALMKVKGKDYTVCNSAFTGYNITHGGGYLDIGLGDAFLRNTFSLFSYGNRQTNGTLGPPYVQLLLITDPVKATADALASRKLKLNLEGWPEQISPASAAAFSENQ